MWLVRDSLDPHGQFREIYDLFEGTEQIQQLVISRAISGLRTEELTCGSVGCRWPCRPPRTRALSRVI
jgi:hypothetical protein